jgi:hypothetical protein
LSSPDSRLLLCSRIQGWYHCHRCSAEAPHYTLGTSIQHARSSN